MSFHLACFNLEKMTAIRAAASCGKRM